MAPRRMAYGVGMGRGGGDVIVFDSYMARNMDTIRQSINEKGPRNYSYALVLSHSTWAMAMKEATSSVVPPPHHTGTCHAYAQARKQQVSPCVTT